MGRKRLFDSEKKWCNKCQDWRPLDAFGSNKRTPSGKSHYCKTCHSTYCGTFWTKVEAQQQLLLEKYQLTPGDYLELWRSQDKKCSICAASLVLYHRGTHVRPVGERRILLCGSCDKGLESFQDNPHLLHRALELFAE